MKPKRLLSLLLIVVLASTLFGCSAKPAAPAPAPAAEPNEAPAPTESVQPSPATLNFVISVHDPTIPWVQPMRAAGEDISKEFGVNVQFTGPTPPDAVKQLEQIIALNEQGMMDALAIMPLEDQTIRPYIDKLVDGGVPVVTVGQDSPDSKSLAFFGQSFDSLEEISYQLAKNAIEKLGPNPKGKVAILVSLPDLEALIKREEGAKRAISEYPGLELLGTFSNHTDVVAAYAEIEALLTANPDIVALFAQDAANTPSGAKVLRDLGIKDKVAFSGYDMTEECLLLVRDGNIDFLVGQNPYEQAYMSLKALYEYKVNGVQPVTVEVEADYATPENIGEFLRAYNISN